MKWKPEDGIENGCHAETGTILKIEFSNTNLLDADVTSTVASAHVYNGGVEITSQYAESYFEWSRDSGNTTADATWNAAHKEMKSVTINRSELSANTQFTCTLTKIQPTCGDIMVDEDGNLLYAASENGDNFFLDEDGYLCVENPKNSYKFDGADLSMDTTTSLGTVTATSWVYTASGSDKVVEFKYNAAGLRVQKDVTVNDVKTTTKYILNGKLLAELQCGNDVLKFDYDGHSKPAQVCFNNTTFTYIHNLQGDIVSILDCEGNCIVEYKYDAWGRLLSTTGTLGNMLGKSNPFRYRGYVYDEETGMYYCRSRYYSPEMSRFINLDNMIPSSKMLLGVNLFAYCCNTPVNHADPSGHSFKDVVMAIQTGMMGIKNILIKGKNLFTGTGKKYSLYQPPKKTGPSYNAVYKTKSSGSTSKTLYIPSLAILRFVLPSSTNISILSSSHVIMIIQRTRSATMAIPILNFGSARQVVIRILSVHKKLLR